MQSPCPHRIIDDMGQAYCMGFFGGSLWHLVKGYKNAPRGWRNRTYGMVRNVQSKGPVLGGNFAVWGLSFSCWDCIFQHIRKKDDPMNAIAAGFMTGGVLAWRAGWRSAFKSALVGGFLLSVIEGASIGIGKMMAPPDQQMSGPISPYSTYSKSGQHSSSVPPPAPPAQETKWDDDDYEFDYNFDVTSDWKDEDSFVNEEIAEEWEDDRFVS